MLKIEQKYSLTRQRKPSKKCAKRYSVPPKMCFYAHIYDESAGKRTQTKGTLPPCNRDYNIQISVR